MIVVVALDALVITGWGGPVLETNVQVPVAGVLAAFAAMLSVAGNAPLKQASWSGPALAACCELLNTVIVTSSKMVDPHAPLSMVQRNVLAPMPRLVTEVVGLVLLVMTPLPEINVQSPLAGKVGAVAAMIHVVAGAQSDPSGPALAVLMELVKTLTTT